MSRRIEVVEYNPNWVIKYEQEATRIPSVFGNEFLSIHHIGSTAIPGIKAKPVIDILVIVRDTGSVKRFDDEMVHLGYRPRGECLDAAVAGTPGRFYYSKDTNGVRSHQVHVVQKDHFQIDEKLAFRDYLRNHPEEANAYSAMKETLAEKNRYDSAAYANGKSDCIRTMTAKALTWQTGNCPLVEPYNPTWPWQFQQIRAFLEAGIGDVDCAIEHVGSTAIPGMMAKPIIDIDIVIIPGTFPKIREQLEILGYVHQGDLGLAKREAFDLVDNEMEVRLPEHHLYVCDEGGHELRKHLAFRAFMGQHSQWRERLNQLKRDLCVKHNNDRQAYIDGKAAMVEEITKLAMESSEEIHEQ